MSTGLPTLAAAGRNDRSSACVVSLSAGSCEAVGLARVGGQDAGTAGVRQDGDPRALGHRLMREQRGDVEQLFEPLGPDDAGLPEQRVDHRIARRERAGVRCGGARAGRRSPGFHRDDRLASARRVARSR